MASMQTVAQAMARRRKPPPPRHTNVAPRTVRVEQGYAPDRLVSTNPLYRPPLATEMAKRSPVMPVETPDFRWSTGRKPRRPRPVPRLPKV